MVGGAVLTLGPPIRVAGHIGRGPRREAGGLTACFNHARYDGASNVTRVLSSNANGTDVNYTFDANNRLATVVDNRTAGTTT